MDDDSTEIGQNVFEFNFDVISQSELEECKRAYEQGGVEGCRQYFKDKQDEWKTIPLNIAVIGNSGVGKSSFINAIRGLTADDEGAAEVTLNATYFRFDRTNPDRSDSLANQPY